MKNTGSSVRAIIVDDEPLGRDRIHMFATARPDIEVVAECCGGREAVEAIKQLDPDLVFLDVQMPDLDGIGVVEEIGADQMPAVIFITAYDRHAVKAFEVHALDYLLKPFRVDRFNRAVDRVVRIIQEGKSVESGLGKMVGNRSRYIDRILVKSARKAYFVRASNVDWIEAAGNYLKLHAGDKAHLIRQTMNKLEQQLNPDEFVRIHRSAMVNLGSINELRRQPSGEYEVVLADGTSLRLSRGYRKELNRFDPLADEFAR